MDDSCAVRRINIHSERDIRDTSARMDATSNPTRKVVHSKPSSVK
ncbi:MAG: hypothetical protein NUV75_04660 [Gallionella sp.]|nr:hypothetical protein [Gallionella sp.]